MISNRNKDRISLICYTTVSDLFSTFCNPKNRGSGFLWSSFPFIAAHECKTQTLLSSNIHARNLTELCTHAEQTGKTIAETMVRNAEFED